MFIEYGGLVMVDFFQLLFVTFVVSWVIIFIYLFLFLYFNYSREYKIKDVGKVTTIPKYINPANLSKLLYNKIIPETFTSTLLGLINKGVLYFKEDDGVKYLCVNRDNDYRLISSEKFAIKLIINYVGDGEKVSLDYLEHYCDSYNGSSNFYVNYQVWLKMILRETSDTMYYEPKMGYYKIKAFKYIGIMLWTINFYVGLRIPFVYFIIIPAFYILYYYYSVYRRTPDSQRFYTEWESYKEYLLETKHIKREDAIYAPILYINDKCQFDEDEDINRLVDIVVNDIKRANSYGSKGPAI